MIEQYNIELEGTFERYNFIFPKGQTKVFLQIKYKGKYSREGTSTLF